MPSIDNAAAAPSAIRYYNLGNVDPEVYRLLAGVMSGCHHFTVEVVRLYEMKANSIYNLHATRNKGAAANMGSATSFAKPPGKSTCKDDEKPEEPGTLIATLPEKGLSPSEVSSLFTALQNVSIADDVTHKYNTGKKRDAAIARGVEMYLEDLKIDSKSKGKELNGKGQMNNGVYLPSKSFQKTYAKAVAKIAAARSEDVTVTAVAVYRQEGIQGVEVTVFYTLRLAEGRCFLCDRRDLESSETDSESGSQSRSSEVSSSQKNFRDSKRYECPRAGTVRFGCFDLSISLSQFVVAQGCAKCGQYVPQCPNHQKLWDALSSEEHVKWTFDGSSMVEESKRKEGKHLVNPYSVPNKKVFFQQHSRAASEGEFEHKTQMVAGTRIVIPVIAGKT